MNPMTMPSEHSEQEAPERPRAGRRKLRWLGLATGALGLLVLAAPTALSTRAGITLLQWGASTFGGGSLALESLSLAWFSGQSLAGLAWSDATGASSVELRSMRTELSLWQALRGDLALGRTEVDGLDAVLVLPESAPGDESAPSAPGGSLVLPSSLSIDAALHDAKITLRIEGQEPLTIEGLDFELALPAVSEPATFAGSAVYRQGELRGRLAVHGELRELFAADGTLDLERAVAQLELDAGDLACAGIDRLLQLEGLLVLALGETVGVKVRLNAALGAGDLELVVDAPLLTITLAGRVRDDTFELTQPVRLETTLSPELIERFAPMADSPSLPRLREAVPIELAIERLRVPLAGFEPSQVALRSSLRIGRPVRLVGEGPIAELVLSAFSAVVQTDDLGAGVALECALDLDQGGVPARLRVHGDVRGLFDEQGEVRLEGLAGDVVAEFSGLSAELLDQLAGTEGLVQALCGPDLGVKLTAASHDGVFDVRLALSAEKIDAEELVLSIDENLVLAGPVRLRTTLDPALVEALVEALDLGPDLPRLAAPLPIELVLERLEAPLPGPDEPAFQPARTSLAAAVRLGELHLVNVPELGELHGRGWELTVNGASLSALALTLSGQLTGPDRPGLFADVLGSEPLSIELRAQGGIDADARPGAVEAHLNLSSERLNAYVALGLAADLERVTLLEPATLEGVVDPALLDRLGLAETGLARLSGPTRWRLTLDQLTTPIAGFDLSALRVRAALHVDAAGESDALAVLLGESLDVTATLEGTDAGSKLGLHIASANLALDASGRFDHDQRFVLDAPATLSFVVSPEGLALLGVSGAEDPVLARPATIEVTVDELRAALADFTPANLFVTAQVGLDELDLPGAEGRAGARLEGILTRLTFDGAAGTLVVALEAQARASGDEASSPLAIDARLTDLFRGGEFDPARASLAATARLEQVPTALLDSLAGQDGALVSLLGPALDVELTTHLESLAELQGAVTLDVNGEHIRADLRAKLDRTLELTEPAHLWLEVTPPAFAALSRPAQPAQAAGNPSEAQAGGADPAPPPALAQPATFEVLIESLRWPMTAADGPAGFDPAAATLRAALTSEALTLLDPATGATLTLAGLKATIGAASLAAPLEISISGWLGDPASHAADVPDNFELAATLTELFGDDGVLDAEQLAADWTVRVSELAVAPLGAWAGEEALLSVVLGPELGLVGAGTFAGTGGDFDVRIEASHAQAHIAGAVRGGELHLSEPLTAQLDATPELGRELLSDLHPYLRGIVTDQPIALMVSEHGFVLPIAPFDATGATIERAELDIGRVTIEGNKALLGLLGLMKRGQDGAVPAWFAPLVISLGDGRVTFIRRLDILLDRDVHVVTWGSTELATGTYHQTLALSGDTLRNVLGLEHVDVDDMLRIPIEGSSGSPRIGYVQAAKELGRLQAEDAALSAVERKLKKANPLIALVLKGQVEKAAKKLSRSLGSKRSDPPPPPAVKPLPWQ